MDDFTELEKKVYLAGAAVANKLISKKTAREWIAKDFGVDPKEEAARIEEEKKSGK